MTWLSHSATAFVTRRADVHMPNYGKSIHVLVNKCSVSIEGGRVRHADNKHCEGYGHIFTCKTYRLTPIDFDENITSSPLCQFCSITSPLPWLLKLVWTPSHRISPHTPLLHTEWTLPYVYNCNISIIICPYVVLNSVALGWGLRDTHDCGTQYHHVPWDREPVDILSCCTHLQQCISAAAAGGHL